MRILILRGGALGDLLVSFPALRLLRDHWPAARIELVGNARAAELALLSGLINAVHSQHEGRWGALFNLEALLPEFSAWLDSFDLVVSYWPDVDGALQSHFRHRRDTFIGSHARPNSRPAAKHFCAALAPLGLSTDVFRSRLELPPALLDEAGQRLKGLNRFVALHPGSGSAAKNWPMERWVEVCRQLQRPTLIVTGEVERTAVSWPESSTVQHARQWPLPLLAAALTRAAFYLGHDTGISHLAAAVGAKCLLLFGPTDPEIWAPPGENVKVLKKGYNLTDVSVDEVLAATALM